MQTLHFVIGSVTGTARRCANNTQHRLMGKYHIHLYEYATLDDLPLDTAQTLVFFVANTGAGELPSMMQRIYIQLTQRCYDMSGHQYLVVNFGDSRYPEFGVAGENLHAALAEANAQPLAEVLTFDAAMGNPSDVSVSEWLEQHLR